MSTPMVSIRGLSKTFHDTTVLRDVDLDCAAQQTLCIIGPSGSGKSTLLRCINHLEKPDRGTIAIDGELQGYERRRHRIIELSDRRIQRQRQRVGMVFQRFNVFPHLAALENVAIAPRLLTSATADHARARAMTHLERVGLAGKSGAFARQLSGGQQQRVAIARALAMEPKVMLFDEPTSALDPELVGEVLSVMRDIARQGMTMIVVTHEMRFAREVATEVAFMDAGRVIERGPADALLTNPQHPRTRAFLAGVF